MLVGLRATFGCLPTYLVDKPSETGYNICRWIEGES